MAWCVAVKYYHEQLATRHEGSFGPFSSQATAEDLVATLAARHEVVAARVVEDA